MPRHIAPSATGNAPYTALGKRYVPLASAAGYVRRGVASWYGEKFHGRRTSSGEPYDMFAMTAAHPTLPLPSFARVENLANGRAVVVKVNDRGPFLHDRIIDLSYAAAHKLGIAAAGTGRVEVRAITVAPAASEPVAEILIQVGAFAEVANAEAMRETLRRAGYPVVAPPESAADSALHRVRVGPYSSHAEAQTARQKLEELLARPVAMVAPDE